MSSQTEAILILEAKVKDMSRPLLNVLLDKNLKATHAKYEGRVAFFNKAALLVG